MKNRTFLEDLFQSIGFIAAIMVALSQYFLSSNFELLFSQKPEFFNISNIIVIAMTFSIILGVYAARHTIDSKIYFNKKKRDKYWRMLEEQKNRKEDKDFSAKKPRETEIISEPWGFTIRQLAYVSIPLIIGVFAILLNSQNILVISIAYVSLMCLIVFSLSVFAIRIYTSREHRGHQEKVYLETLNKINTYFAGKINIKLEYMDRSNWMCPLRTMILEHQGKSYLVKTDANDPNSYFEITELKLKDSIKTKNKNAT